jgi:hypothetical protein
MLAEIRHGLAAHLLTRDEARRVAANIAKLRQGAAAELQKPRASIGPLPL